MNIEVIELKNPYKNELLLLEYYPKKWMLLIY